MSGTAPVCSFRPTSMIHPSLFQRREAELSAWALPARELYTGLQHRYMMNGVDAIRHRFGTSACSVKIVSAGYGLVDEEQRLANTRQHFKDSVRNGFGNKQIGWGFRVECEKLLSATMLFCFCSARNIWSASTRHFFRASISD
jgi:hypothetical protein